ncbi:MAG: ATP-binding cassette domain-containing protein [Spirosomataceae bacterium]
MTISIQNLHFEYFSQEIFEDLNLTIEQGSIYGLLGLNGAGKSTLIKLILGLYQPTLGEITIWGEKMTAQNRNDIIKNIGVLIEQATVYTDLTAYENLKISQQIQGLPTSFITEALESVNLTESSHKKVKAFSMGMKQRLGLALAILAKPKLIILDEPTNGLDPFGIFEFRETVLRLNKTQGITFLLSTHILTDLEQFATDFCILHHKKIVNEGKIKNILKKNTLEEFFRSSIQTNNNLQTSI